MTTFTVEQLRRLIVPPKIERPGPVIEEALKRHEEVVRELMLDSHWSLK